MTKRKDLITAKRQALARLHTSIENLERFVLWIANTYRADDERIDRLSELWHESEELYNDITK